MRKNWKSPPNTHIHTLHVMVMLPAGAVLHQHTTQSQIVFLLICWHFYNRTLLRFDLIVDLCWTYRDRYTARYQKQLNIMSIFQFFFNWPAPGDWGWFYTGAKKKKQQEKTLFLFFVLPLMYFFNCKRLQICFFWGLKLKYKPTIWILFIHCLRISNSWLMSLTAQFLLVQKCSF